MKKNQIKINYNDFPQLNRTIKESWFLTKLQFSQISDLNLFLNILLLLFKNTPKKYDLQNKSETDCIKPTLTQY